MSKKKIEKREPCPYCGVRWAQVQVSPSCDMDERGDPVSPRYEWRRGPCDENIIHPRRRARRGGRSA